MKKAFLILALAFGLSKAYAVQSPVSAQGHEIQTLDYVGAYNTCWSTSTQFVQCGSAQQFPTSPANPQTNLPALNPSILYGVIASSIANTEELSFFDATTTVPSASTGVTFGATYGYLSTVTVVFNNSNMTTGSSNTATTTNFYKFPVPIQFNYGIVVKSPTYSETGGPSIWTILWRPLNSKQN